MELKDNGPEEFWLATSAANFMNSFTNLLKSTSYSNAVADLQLIWRAGLIASDGRAGFIICNRLTELLDVDVLPFW